MKEQVQAPAQAPAQEIKRLQRCINDLVSLLALPAIWSASEPSQIVEMLLDALLNMLSLEFVCARLNHSVAAAPVQILRVSDSCRLKVPPHDITVRLGDWLNPDGQISPPPAGSPFGENISTFPVPLGIHGEIGMIVVGSERANFPSQTESLLLTVAANQASIGLREARLLSEEKRISAALDQRVTERTAGLAAVNEELSKEIAERRRAEEAQRESEQRFRLIVDGIAGLVAIMKPTGEVEVVNRQVLEYFGGAVDDLRGWAMSDAVHPEDLPRVISAWTHSIGTISVYDVDHRLRRADGVYRWFHARGLPLCDPEGRVLRWYVLLTDIHDRKRAEEALRASERELGLVVNTIPALAWSARPDGSAEFFNQLYLDYVGLPLEELQGSGWARAAHPDDVDTLVGAWQSMMTSGKPGEVEGRLRRFDGEYRWFLFRTNPVLDDSGRILKWYGTNSDIDDRKRSEEQVRRSEAFLAEAQHLSLTGSFSWHLTGNQITWSEQLYRIFEFDRTVPVSLELIASRVHPEDKPLMYDMVEQARVGRNFDYEHRLLMPGGSVKHLHMQAHATRDKDGGLEYIGAVQDVTQRRLSEEALAKARLELAKVASITSLGVLTASITHEVNQPLSGIITNANTCLRMLSADPPNVEGARETARRTIRDGNRASDVITRLRTLYSKKEPALEALDLNEAAREVTALASPEILRSGAILRYELADDLPPVVGDRIQLQQVILNLLRNAADAMNAIDNRPRELLIRTQRDSGHRARLSVKDSGIGFTPQAADKIFEAFYTTKADGMGIGLSISHSIIEAHQGRLWATPNDGPGCTFSFVIPCALKASKDADATLDAADPSVDAA